MPQAGHGVRDSAGHQQQKQWGGQCGQSAQGDHDKQGGEKTVVPQGVPASVSQGSGFWRLFMQDLCALRKRNGLELDGRVQQSIWPSTPVSSWCIEGSRQERGQPHVSKTAAWDPRQDWFQELTILQEHKAGGNWASRLTARNVSLAHIIKHLQPMFKRGASRRASCMRLSPHGSPWLGFSSNQNRQGTVVFVFGSSWWGGWDRAILLLSSFFFFPPPFFFLPSPFFFLLSSSFFLLPSSFLLLLLELFI